MQENHKNLGNKDDKLETTNQNRSIQLYCDIKILINDLIQIPIF